MTRTSTIATLVAAGLLGMGAATASASQLALAAAPAERKAGPVDPHEYETRAKSMFSTPKRYDEAIKLLLKAAETRDIGDPVRVQDVIMASRLAFYREDTPRSQALMQRAADEAAATGDVITAAHAYMDAAFIAREGGEPSSILNLVKKAEMLAHSPLISEKDKDGILVRIRSGQ